MRAANRIPNRLSCSSGNRLINSFGSLSKSWVPGRHYGSGGAWHLQHRGGFARDVLGVEDQKFAGVRRRAIDQGDDVAIAFRRGGTAWHKDRLARHIARVEHSHGAVVGREVDVGDGVVKKTKYGPCGSKCGLGPLR